MGLRFCSIKESIPVQDAGVLRPCDIVNLNAQNKSIVSNQLSGMEFYDLGNDIPEIHKRGFDVNQAWSKVQHNKKQFAAANKQLHNSTTSAQ